MVDRKKVILHIGCFLTLSFAFALLSGFESSLSTQNAMPWYVEVSASIVKNTPWVIGAFIAVFQTAIPFILFRLVKQKDEAFYWTITSCAIEMMLVSILILLILVSGVFSEFIQVRISQ